MLTAFFERINPIQLYVFVTFLIAVSYYKPRNETANFLFLILFINFTTEFVSTILISENRKLGLFNTISSLLHNSLWLILLYKSIKQRTIYKVVFGTFITFAMINLAFWEGLQQFNCNTFIIGAFLYLIVFIYESFDQLKKEQFSFFLSDHYLLLFAPVFFFCGLSFIFGFKSSKLASTVLFGHIYLYQFIAYLVNIVYYSLINIYIYREKKGKDAD